MQKDTSKIVEELGLCPDFQTFYNENKDYMVCGNLAALLTQLLEEKGLKKSQVIKHAELSEVYGYQIFSGVRVPERRKLLCLAVGMRLNIEETQQLLNALEEKRQELQSSDANESYYLEVYDALTEGLNKVKDYIAGN